MGTIVLKNEGVPCGILMDLRFSNGGLAFSDLPNVPGFPRSLEHHEILSIPMHDWKELLYKRIYSVDNHTRLVRAEIYRIAAPGESETIDRTITGG